MACILVSSGVDHQQFDSSLTLGAYVDHAAFPFRWNKLRTAINAIQPYDSY